jgi:hypothetical protein
MAQMNLASFLDALNADEWTWQVLLAGARRMRALHEQAAEGGG